MTFPDDKLKELKEIINGPFDEHLAIVAKGRTFDLNINALVDRMEASEQNLESKTTALQLEQKLTVGLTINCQELQKKIIALRDENEELKKESVAMRLGFYTEALREKMAKLERVVEAAEEFISDYRLKIPHESTTLWDSLAALREGE